MFGLTALNKIKKNRVRFYPQVLVIESFINPHLNPETIKCDIKTHDVETHFSLIVIKPLTASSFFTSLFSFFSGLSSDRPLLLSSSEIYSLDFAFTGVFVGELKNIYWNAAHM